MGCLIRSPCSLHSTETRQRMNRGRGDSIFVPGYLICQMLARVGDTTAARGGLKRTIKEVLKRACPRGGNSYHPMWPRKNYRGSWHMAAGFPKAVWRTKPLASAPPALDNRFMGQTWCQCSIPFVVIKLIMNSVSRI